MGYKPSSPFSFTGLTSSQLVNETVSLTNYWRITATVSNYVDQLFGAQTVFIGTGTYENFTLSQWGAGNRVDFYLNNYGIKFDNQTSDPVGKYNIFQYVGTANYVHTGPHTMILEKSTSGFSVSLNGTNITSAISWYGNQAETLSAWNNVSFSSINIGNSVNIPMDIEIKFEQL
jgi:hypothetical protein